jgi:RNA polymerase sigma factor (sigma-70 family)
MGDRRRDRRNVAAVSAEAVTPPPEVRRREVAGLLERAQAGDRHALDEIVGRLMPLVWNVVRAQGLDHETASDVVQTVWLTLLQGLNQIREPAALGAWLVTVARRESYRARDRDRRHADVVPDGLESHDAGVDIESYILKDERYECLWRHLRTLSPRCQELLRIVAFIERPSYEAVSAALGMPKGSIGPVRGRCLSRLRTLLTNDPTWSAP